ncbi:MAG: hypothetical protein P4M00_23160 [Azospirillaceae bacterium]|nr:hypothetical protein [Azospirillaceae bacterium]
MVLVDRSAWIEWLIGSPTGGIVAADLPSRGQWLVPTIVQLELAKWLTREVGEEKADQVIAFTETCLVVDLTPGLRCQRQICVRDTSWRQRRPSFTRRHSSMVPSC